MEQRIASGRRDLFRTRKQNTSRPPSMHVDDFMAKVSNKLGLSVLALLSTEIIICNNLDSYNISTGMYIYMYTKTA